MKDLTKFVEKIANEVIWSHEEEEFNKFLRHVNSINPEYISPWRKKTTNTLHSSMPTQTDKTLTETAVHLCEPEYLEGEPIEEKIPLKHG